MKQKIFKLINVLYIITTLIFMISIIRYNVLPLKYLIPLLLVQTIISIILVINKKLFTKIISVVIIIIYIPILFLLGKTFNFIEKIQEDGKLYENYSIIVLNNHEEELNKIEKLGYYYQENQSIYDALEKVNEIKTQDFENIEETANALIENKVDAIILEDTYYRIYGEENKDFRNQTKIIYSFQIEKNVQPIKKEVNTKQETFNIYISGIDTYGNISSVSRSDVNIIATINPNTNKILLTTIPRYYYVQLDGTTGLKDKLTHAGIYGVEKSVKTIENLLDIDINYYVKVNFSSVEKIVDTLDGVNVYSKYSFIGYEGSYFHEGYNYVYGKQALEFARTRKTIEGGDRTRGKNQEALIEAILERICSKEILTKYTQLLDTLEDSFQTNLAEEEITTIIKKQIDEGKSWQVESISVDGENAHRYTYSYGGRELFVIIPNEETIRNFKERYEDTIK